jgi:hypothetical protein
MTRIKLSVGSTVAKERVKKSEYRDAQARISTAIRPIIPDRNCQVRYPMIRRKRVAVRPAVTRGVIDNNVMIRFPVQPLTLIDDRKRTTINACLRLPLSPARRDRVSSGLFFIQRLPD